MRPAQRSQLLTWCNRSRPHVSDTPMPRSYLLEYRLAPHGDTRPTMDSSSQKDKGRQMYILFVGELWQKLIIEAHDT